jgi:predicted amidohydrolase
MRIAACQTPEILGDLDTALRLVHEFAAGSDADLLLFPECFLPGYLVDDQHVRTHALDLASPEFARVAAGLAGLRPTLVIGLIERAAGRYFNTAVVLAGGTVLGRYRKTFLTAGEAVFDPGDDCPVFECAGTRFGVNICYDTRFPAAPAAVAAAGARVLLVPAQNMMPRHKAYAWQPRHNEIRARRARETGLWLVSADVTGERGDRIGLGPTCVLNPAGEVVAQVPAGEVGTATADVS